MGRALGVFFQQGGRRWKKCCLHTLLGIVQPPCQEGKMPATHAIPAISGRLILVGVVMQAFALLELEGYI